MTPPKAGKFETAEEFVNRCMMEHYGSFREDVEVTLLEVLCKNIKARDLAIRAEGVRLGIEAAAKYIDDKADHQIGSLSVTLFGYADKIRMIDASKIAGEGE